MERKKFKKIAIKGNSILFQENSFMRIVGFCTDGTVPSYLGRST